MEAKRFDAAIAAYNRVLELDPGHVAAHTGKSNAVTAKTIAEATASGSREPARPVHAFVAGRDRGQGAGVVAGPPGFERSPERRRQARHPGRRAARARSSSRRPRRRRSPGERFSVSAYLRNEGAQPIQLASHDVATTVDGRTQKGRVPPATHDGRASRPRARLPGPRPAAPGRHEAPGRSRCRSFTAAGETYRNTLSWK